MNALSDLTYGVQGVGQAGHQLGLDELRFATLELGLFLNSEGGRLQAELVNPVVASLELLKDPKSPLLLQFLIRFPLHRALNSSPPGVLGATDIIS